jgi:hypothetical protein
MLDGCTVAACASKDDTPKVRAVAAATDNKTRFFMMCVPLYKVLICFHTICF